MEAVKTFLREYCGKWVKARESLLQGRIAELKQALESETKSSAGDKHETGRAMIHLELEKTARALAEAQRMLAVLKRIPNLRLQGGAVSLGSVVICDAGRYYLSVPAGPVSFKNQEYWCVSAGSPIGMALMGKTAGEALVFQKKPLKILEIY